MHAGSPISYVQDIANWQLLLIVTLLDLIRRIL